MTIRKCQTCGKNRQERFYTSARGRVCTTCQKKTRRATARSAHVAKTYDLTAERHQRILDAQDGVCAICKGDRPYNLPVDHDHALAEIWGLAASVRGLLCKRCNKLLRDVGDSPTLLRAAADYLEDPPARKVA